MGFFGKITVITLAKLSALNTTVVPTVIVL